MMATTSSPATFIHLKSPFMLLIFTFPLFFFIFTFILPLGKQALQPTFVNHYDDLGLYSDPSSPPTSPPEKEPLVLNNNKNKNKNSSLISEPESDNNRDAKSSDDDSGNNGLLIKSGDMMTEVIQTTENEKPIFTDNTAVKTFLKTSKDCDLYDGNWVKDEEHHPIYKPGSCPYVDEAFDCQNNGRLDEDYMRWRWKPNGCDLLRFNASDFLMRLRGKRLMLVGDSMNRNQFESLLCVLREGLQNKSEMYEVHGYKITKGRGFYIFKFPQHNCTVEFVRSHFLVKEGTRINGDGNSNPTLSIDQIDKSANRWKKADILVFNTGHWWTHGKTARGKNYYKEGDFIYPQFDALEAYRKSLKTWASWIDNNLNPDNNLVIYRGYSSAHFRGGDWDSGGSCNGEKEPISTITGSFLDTYPIKMKITEEVIKEMKVPVVLLNVTHLTNFRKDGHPSVYGKNLTSGRKVSNRRQDCSHWCLPGVPDAWNELIYAVLISHQANKVAAPEDDQQ
ncbi:protein trichome birefringence-like 5 [Impatiens glandulifera]|uniref:protein trichome birefringence-like 5 n=1 Tax=Impatiens glandulifera TaxID=253017 RepID=UPI001FB113CF|nr:protein trichome birefringence-like 5 [Impatiens glandulifera]